MSLVKSFRLFPFFSPAMVTSQQACKKWRNTDTPRLFGVFVYESAHAKWRVTTLSAVEHFERASCERLSSKHMHFIPKNINTEDVKHV